MVETKKKNNKLPNKKKTIKKLKNKIDENKIQKGGAEMEITHFWYRDWPDRGAPNLSNPNIKKNFIKFIDMLYNDIQTNKGGTVIHCSAGVGRTGTVFVILKICLFINRPLSNIKSVKVTYNDVIFAITYARQHRELLVQTYEQLEFICKLFSVDGELKIKIGTQNKDTYTTEIGKDEISKLKYRTLENRIGKKLECNQKNRYSNIIPYDETRVIIKDDNDLNCKGYINANYLNSKDGKKLDRNGFEEVVIATQGPLDSTTPQFLKMLIENNIKRIIMVTNIVEEGKKKCSDYKKKKDSNDGNLTTLPKEADTFGNIGIYTLPNDPKQIDITPKLTFKNEIKITPIGHPPELLPPPEQLPPLVNDPSFFETQYSLGCGRHALNNLFGGKYFLKNNDTTSPEYNDTKYTLQEAKLAGGKDLLISKPFFLSRFCKYLADIEFIQPTVINEDTYCPENENYDVNVIEQALRYCGFPIDSLNIADDSFINDGANNDLVGYIINYGRGHWVSLKYNKNDIESDSKYEYFDSIHPPGPLGNTKYKTIKEYRNKNDIKQTIKNKDGKPDKYIYRFQNIIKVNKRNTQIFLEIDPGIDTDEEKTRKILFMNDKKSEAEQNKLKRQPIIEEIKIKIDKFNNLDIKFKGLIAEYNFFSSIEELEIISGILNKEDINKKKECFYKFATDDNTHPNKSFFYFIESYYACMANKLPEEPIKKAKILYCYN